MMSSSIDPSVTSVGQRPTDTATPRAWAPWRSWNAVAGGPGPLHTRHDLPAGGKKVTWERGARPVDLVYFATGDNRPPAAGSPLVVVEGEKAADAVAAAGFVAGATVCGAPAQPSDAVVALLARYAVTLSPDNDDAGRKHMMRIAERLERQGAESCRWLDPPSDAPEHWDLADVDADVRRDLVEGAPALKAWGARAAIPTVRGIDAADLLALQLPPLQWIVPGVFPEGTTVLAAPPKVGKSCLIYQAAVECAVGGTLLGRQVAPGSVLYLALEDGRRRGQDRLLAALHGRTMPRGRLEVRWDASNIGEGLEDEIAGWLHLHSDAALVAIDTLGKVRPRSDGRRNAYEVDVAALGRLQGLFRDRRTALVIVHHARKEASDDFLTSVSGTYGITGSADTIVVLRRKRNEEYGTLAVTGRDVPDAEIPVQFDSLTWHEAPGALPVASAQQAATLRVLETTGPVFAKAIADQLGLERTSVQHILSRLAAEGVITRTATGYVATSPVSPASLPSLNTPGRE